MAFYLVTAVLAFALAIETGAWERDGMMGVVIAMVVAAIPAMLIIAIAFPVSVPLLLALAYGLDRLSDRKPA